MVESNNPVTPPVTRSNNEPPVNQTQVEKKDAGEQRPSILQKQQEAAKEAAKREAEQRQAERQPVDGNRPL